MIMHKLYNKKHIRLIISLAGRLLSSTRWNEAGRGSVFSAVTEQLCASFQLKLGWPSYTLLLAYNGRATFMVVYLEQGMRSLRSSCLRHTTGGGSSNGGWPQAKLNLTSAAILDAGRSRNNGRNIESEWETVRFCRTAFLFFFFSTFWFIKLRA